MKNSGPLKKQLGQWTIWSLCDGHLDLDQRVLFNKELPVIQNQLRNGRVDFQEECLVRTSVYAYLIDTGKYKVLVDTGCGNFFGEVAGFLMDQFKDIGFDPAKITHVFLTHLHVDHMGGLLDRDGNAAFPGAILCVSKNDADFWRDASMEDKSMEVLRPAFSMARKVLAPYESNGKLQFIRPNEVIVPGVEVVKAFGHTCGHLAFRFSSENKTALLWGDLVHTAGIQLEKPHWKVSVDTDPEQAIESRDRLFAEAADQKYLLGGGHVPNPGFGYISRRDDHFIWESLKG